MASSRTHKGGSDKILTLGGNRLVGSLDSIENIRKRLVGKRVTLGNSVFWSNGNITISGLVEPTSNAKESSFVLDAYRVESGIADKDLLDLELAIRAGTLRIVEEEEEPYVSTSELNDENVVKVYSEYEELLLAKDRQALRKRLDEKRNSGTLTIEYLEGLLKEETTTRNRKDFVEEINSIIAQLSGQRVT